MSYRVEYAPSARASCKSNVCGKQKIARGSLRFGTFANFGQFQSFQWRHWGCVTTRVISNLNQKYQSATEIDGYEDLDQCDQQRISLALEEGDLAPGDKSIKPEPEPEHESDLERDEDDMKVQESLGDIPPSDDMASSGAHSEIENSVMSARKLAEQEARIILAKLGDLHATRQLLRVDLKLCDQMDVWLGPSIGVHKIRNAIKAAIAAIRSEFSTRLAEAEPFVTRRKDIGPFKEAFIWQHRHIKYKFKP